MRGIRRRMSACSRPPRISPAHAGNTGEPASERQPGADQPRTCGEYFLLYPPTVKSNGSAPHMRGIRGVNVHDHQGARISPAHAGNTGCAGVGRGGWGDQPRTCGEYQQRQHHLCYSAGSAPHMRGIPVMASGSGRRPWISPAHAGNTRRPGGERRRQPDQPRTCGEYGVSGRACSRLRDQPRTCGEYHSPARAGLTGMGSAPHMRGIHGEVARGLSHVRISPAHAGNTPRSPGSS